MTAKNKYMAFYQGDTYALEAESMLLAKLDAISEFQKRNRRTKVRQTMVSVVLLQLANGDDVIHSAASL